MAEFGSSLSAAREPPPDYDLSICIHRHEMIATAVETEHDRPVPVRLYHWHPPTVSKMTTVFLSPSALSAIDDFTALGTFFLQDDLDIPETLSKLLAAAAEVAPPSPPSSTTGSSSPEPPPTPEEALPALIAQLDVPESASTSSTFVRFFSFPVYSDSPADQLLRQRDGLVPVWKWEKPDSPYYRKWGFWEADLGAALEDGAWNGGRELRVLVRGVEEVRRVIARGERRFTRLEGVMGAG